MSDPETGSGTPEESQTPTAPDDADDQPTGGESSTTGEGGNGGGEGSETPGEGGGGGEASGEESVDGVSESTVHIQLQPPKYKIELRYLGSRRIRRVKGGDYNCSYELLDGGNPMAPLVIVPNIVREGTDDNDSVKAATPTGQGEGEQVGDNTNPASDTVIKVMIDDFHGTRTAENLDLLGANGDNISNVDYYEDRDWLADVKPAVPFRIIVRKFIGGAQVDMDDDFKVVFSVKDPVEDFDQNQGTPREFLEDFFTKFNADTGNASTGDDNAAEDHGGQRDHGASDAEDRIVKATDVLKKTDYAAPPELHQPNASGSVGADSIDFSALSDADGHGDRDAEFTLTAVTEGSKKVGAADLAFCPWPAGGDNYRFLMTLIDADGKDVRSEDRDEPAALIDDQDTPIVEPRAYVTGKFVLWRRIKFELCVLACETQPSDINWDFIVGAYRRMFIEVVPPEPADGDDPGGYYTLVRERWKTMVQDAYSGVSALRSFIGSRWHFRASVYRTTLFPDGAVGSDDEDTTYGKVKQFARDAIAYACSQATPAIPDPSSGDSQSKQDDGRGLYMFLCKETHIGGTLGAYMGDRIFFMRKPDGDAAVDWATSTCAHEFGHVRSLRHSHTSSAYAIYRSGGSDSDLYIAHPTSNNRPLDHDPKDAFACLMGYLRSLTSVPCGMCALSMRFYNRVEVQSDGQYRQELTRRCKPAIYVTYDGSGDDPVLEPAGASVSLDASSHETVEILALGRATNFTDRSGNSVVGRFNMTPYPAGEADKWLASPGGVVSLSYEGSGTALVRVRVRAMAAGTTTLYYRRGKDPTLSITINVT